MGVPMKSGEPMHTRVQSGTIEAPTPCIARQPILTADEAVIGYELFFREDLRQQRFSSDRDAATSATIDALNLVGLSVLCDGRLAFINCTHDMLLTDYFALLPPADVVVEIQETVAADDAVIEACKRLNKGGYSIALDNFVPGDARMALLPYTRFIKVDFTRVSQGDCATPVALHSSGERRMLAQKVETREKFLTARQIGFTRFQGYFFQRPENLSARQIPASQATYLRLLTEVSKPQIDLSEIEDLIKREPSLCYRLLRYLNSPLLGLSSPVHSVRNALTLLGERETIKWIRMATTLTMGQNKASDLVLASLVRARFCELIAPKVEHGTADLFLMGMLSLVDAILAVPIGVVINELSLEADIKAQLLAAKAGRKTPLSPIYELMVAREIGDWGLATQLGKQLNLSLSFIAHTSNDAMRWAHEVTNASSPQAEDARAARAT
jgi:c-di-GMP-related signal transduction protein